MKQLTHFFCAIAIGTLMTACATPTHNREKQNLAHENFKSGYAPVNGIQMYYEIHGSGNGVPLVLLNGGGSTIEVPYSQLIPIFARDRKVIALEEQAHGRTTDRNQPLRAETSAADVVALLKYLNVNQADIMGFSNGAGVAMQVAIKNPEIVHKLVYISYFTKRTGAYPWLWDAMRKANFENMPQPLKEASLKVNPDLEKLKNMCAKDIERMKKFKDVPDKDIRSIRAETLIIIGDRDVTKPEHAIELSHKIPKTRLMILPGAHGEFLGELLTAKPNSRAPEFTAGFIEEFLNQ